MLTDAIFFISNRQIGAIRPDGEGERRFAFDAPPQNSWQLVAVFDGGRRAILLSQAFALVAGADYYSNEGLGHARTHLWIYAFATQHITEIDLPTGMVLTGVLPGEERLLISGNVDGGMQLFTCNLAGGERHDMAQIHGYGYGTVLSPDATQAAFHLCGRTANSTYEIFIADLATRALHFVAGEPTALLFGPAWSPDGEWLLYQNCHHRTDPGHDRSDLCLSRADGSAHKTLTSGQQHWCGTSYGHPGNHGGGTNGPIWTRDGNAITFARVLPGSREAWQYDVDSPDTDHFNRNYQIEKARGGTELCRLDPVSGEVSVIARPATPSWNFRLYWGPDGERLAFCRAVAGASPSLWVMNADGSNEQRLTCGFESKGVDHPRWFAVDDAAFGHP